MEITEEKFENVKNEAKKYYNSLDRINCPYLKKDVQFNKFGFEHILSKSWNRGRSKIEQYTRLRLLSKVVVKEIEGGLPFFWSIYPSWKKEINYNGEIKRVFYSGNLEED